MSYSNKQLHLWCLFNTNDHRTIDGLFFDEVRAVLMALPESEYGFWVVWKDSWPAWKQVTEVEGLLEGIQRPLSIVKPPQGGNNLSEQPQLNDGAHSTSVHSYEQDADHWNDLEEGDVEGGSIKKLLTTTRIEKSPEALVDAGSWGDKSHLTNISQITANSTNTGFVERNYQRYRKQLSIAVIKDEKVFNATTVDISLGGLLLEEALPSWVHGYFKTRIQSSTRKQQVELTSCLIENQDPHARFRIAFLPLQSEKDEKALENWILNA